MGIMEVDGYLAKASLVSNKPWLTLYHKTKYAIITFCNDLNFRVINFRTKRKWQRSLAKPFIFCVKKPTQRSQVTSLWFQLISCRAKTRTSLFWFPVENVLFSEYFLQRDSVRKIWKYGYVKYTKNPKDY